MPRIASPIEPLCWISAISVPTSAASAAQPAIAPTRSRATAKPSAIVASRPWKIASAVAASADAEVDGDERAPGRARPRPAAPPTTALAVVDQVEPGPDGDDDDHDRRQRP